MDAVKVLRDVFERQNTALKEAMDALDEKTVGNTMTANKLHGANGLFSTPGLERDIINAYVRPFGIGAVLPVMPTRTEDPRFGSLTGYTAVIGSQPTTSCVF